MDHLSDSKRAAGAMRFLAELSAVATECAAAGLWDDELTARRRRREEPRPPGTSYSAEARVKAL